MASTAELERALIACVFLDDHEKVVSLDDLTPELFSKDNQALFKATAAYRRAGHPFDILVAEAHLGKETTLALMKAVSAISGVHVYPSYLAELKKIRYMERLTKRLVEDKQLDTSDLEEGMNVFRRKDNVDRKLFGMTSHLHEFMVRYEQRITTPDKDRYQIGIPEIDGVTGYIRPGTLITIGARTGVGKTNISLKIMNNQLQKNVPSLFLSSEMGYDELIERMISLNSSLNLFAIRNGKLNAEDMRKMSDVISQKLYGRYGHIFEISKFDLNGISDLIDRTGAKFVFLDYIQRFNLEGRRNDSRASVLSDIANGLKALTLDKKIIVVAASQLKRRESAGKDKPPTLEDLKDSGGIEEASDIVVLMSHVEENEEIKTIRIAVEKNRQGRTAHWTFAFNKRNCDFKLFEEAPRERR